MNMIYRAKRLDNGEWMQSDSLIRFYGAAYLLDSTVSITAQSNHGNIYAVSSSAMHPFAVEVDLDTVCLWTGLCDKNGERIFDGDIVRNGEAYLVYWKADECDFEMDVLDYDWGAIGPCFTELEAEESEVIGNRWDNPELMEVQE